MNALTLARPIVVVAFINRVSRTCVSSVARPAGVKSGSDAQFLCHNASTGGH
jgi:hypothetical protein